MTRPTTTSLEISRMLTLSTTHVTEQALAMLETEGDTDFLQLSVYDKAGFGFIIYLPEKGEQLFHEHPGAHPTFGNEDNVPECLQHVMQLAYDAGCNILCLDGDGRIVPYLRTYDHDEEYGDGNNPSAETSFKIYLHDKAQRRQEALGTPMRELDLSVRAYNVLARGLTNGGYPGEHISLTAADIMAKSQKELSLFRNMGSRTLDEILLKLAERGLFPDAREPVTTSITSTSKKLAALTVLYRKLDTAKIEILRANMYQKLDNMTTGEFVETVSVYDLLHMDGIGLRTVDDIQEALAGYALTLKDR